MRMSPTSLNTMAFDPVWWQFNMLPSMTLHESHLAAFPPGPARVALQAGPNYAHIWHRHWSRQILLRLGVWERPAAAGDTVAGWLVVYDDAGLHSLAMRMGAVLCAPRVRRCVAGAMVRELSASLGPRLYGLTLLGNDAPHPGLPGTAFASAESAVEHIASVGWGALRMAFQDEDEPFRARMALRLPANAAGPDDLTVREARALAEAFRAGEEKA